MECRRPDVVAPHEDGAFVQRPDYLNARTNRLNFRGSYEHAPKGTCITRIRLFPGVNPFL